MPDPGNPALYQINTRVWMTELFRAALAGMNTYLNAQRDVQYAAPPLLAKWLESFKNSRRAPAAPASVSIRWSKKRMPKV
jgi:hypothetical protein